MYEAYSDYQSMMNLAEEIVTQCALAVHGKLTVDYQVNIVLASLKLQQSSLEISFFNNKFVEAGVMIPYRELRYVWKGPGGGRPCTILLKKFPGSISMNWEMISRLQNKLL